ncbi:SEC-C metal-binding domain-containing protein [Pedococcus dokdonensis]
MLAGSGLSSADSPVEPLAEPDTDVPASSGAGAEAGPVSVDTASTAEKHPTFRAKGLEQPERRPQQLQYSAPGETGDVEHRAVGTVDDTLSPEQLKGASRNGPCPCGSGKKFKMCHGKA